MLFREIIAVYSENRKKPINILRAQNAELLNVEAGGTYSAFCSLKSFIIKTDRMWISLFTVHRFIYLYANVGLTKRFSYELLNIKLMDI
jgi:hypothetical protein